jgi:HSP20 family protein
MTMMQRWEPFQEMLTLREAMDRLFQESFVHPGRSGLAHSEQGWMPINVSEQGDEFEVSAPMAGVKPEDVQISLENDILTIRADSKSENERRDQRWLVKEQQQSRFHRSIRLPTAVSVDEARATFENGVLTVTLPKAPEARPRQIPVSGARTANKAIDVGVHDANSASDGATKSSDSSRTQAGLS